MEKLLCGKVFSRKVYFTQRFISRRGHRGAEARYARFHAKHRRWRLRKEAKAAEIIPCGDLFHAKRRRWRLAEKQRAQRKIKLHKEAMVYSDVIINPEHLTSHPRVSFHHPWLFSRYRASGACQQDLRCLMVFFPLWI